MEVEVKVVGFNPFYLSFLVVRWSSVQLRTLQIVAHNDTSAEPQDLHL